MKKVIVWALTVCFMISLAGCTSSQGTPGQNQPGTQDQNQSENNSQNTDSKTSGKDSKTEGKTPDVIDHFIFHTSDEMRAFMQNYTPEDEFEWKDIMWKMTGDEITMSGSLMVDHEHFTSLKTITKNKTDEGRIPEVLLNVYQEISAKTGLSFEGAEDAIRNILSIEDEQYFTADGFRLRLSKSGKNYQLYLTAVSSKYVPLPYTRKQAETYMATVGGETATETRTVYGSAYTLENQPPLYDWYGTLDENNHLVAVFASYYGETYDKNAEDGKAFFTELASFFLKDNVLEDSLKLLSDNYGVLEKNKSEKINDDGYAVQIWHFSGGWRFSIDISSLNVAPDETQFPNADEMNLLTLDLFARMGIDISSPFTETVLWEDGDMKVVLEDIYYNTQPSVSFVIRMEGIPEGSYFITELTEINGMSADTIKDEIDWYNNSVCSDSALSADTVQTGRIFITIPVLKNAMDFNGLTSLTFSGSYYIESNDRQYTLEDVTIEFGK